jgi:hypothetical protein
MTLAELRHRYTSTSIQAEELPQISTYVSYHSFLTSFDYHIPLNEVFDGSILGGGQPVDEPVPTLAGCPIPSITWGTDFVDVADLS